MNAIWLVGNAWCWCDDGVYSPIYIWPTSSELTPTSACLHYRGRAPRQLDHQRCRRLFSTATCIHHNANYVTFARILSALIYKWAEHGDLFTLQIDMAEHRQCGPSPSIRAEPTSNRWARPTWLLCGPSTVGRVSITQNRVKCYSVNEPG